MPQRTLSSYGRKKSRKNWRRDAGKKATNKGFRWHKKRGWRRDPHGIGKGPKRNIHDLIPPPRKRFTKRRG